MRLFLPTLLLATLTTTVVPTAEASRACYPSSTYRGARAALAEMPTSRELATLDPAIANGFSALQSALTTFLATSGLPCSRATPAYDRVWTAADDLVDDLEGSDPPPCFYESHCSRDCEVDWDDFPWLSCTISCFYIKLWCEEP